MKKMKVLIIVLILISILLTASTVWQRIRLLKQSSVQSTL